MTDPLNTVLDRLYWRLRDWRQGAIEQHEMLELAEALWEARNPRGGYAGGEQE